MDGGGLITGELVIVLNAAGFWMGGYRYVGEDPELPGEALVHDREGGLWRVRADLLLRPKMKAAGDDQAAIGRPEVASGTGGKGTLSGRSADPAAGDGITAAQRRCLFALARKIGFGIDDLRAATPGGSISALSRVQAADLIDRLSGGRGMRVRPQGTATGKQLGLIAHLRDLSGFAPAEFSAWLSKRFGVEAAEGITDKGLASRVIGGLLKMKANRQAGRGSGHGGRRRGNVPATAAGS